MNVKDAVVFITGANRGIGLAFAREASLRGAARVYGGVRNAQGFDVPGVVPVQIDVTRGDSVAAAAAQCADTTLLVNNAGIGRAGTGPLDSVMEQQSRDVFETNYYGVLRVTQAFAPVLSRNGGGAVINVLSNASWLPSPMLAAYAASKAAAWSLTNTLRLQLKNQGTQVLALHVGFVDTDLVKAIDVPKTSPAEVVRQTLDALEAGKDEVLADEGTRVLKRALSRSRSPYLDPSSLHERSR